MGNCLPKATKTAVVEPPLPKSTVAARIIDKKIENDACSSSAAATICNPDSPLPSIAVPSVAAKPNPRYDITTVAGTNNSIVDVDDGSLQQQQQQPPFSMDTIPDEIWIVGILPFIGPGEYIFVAGISKTLKKLYREYFGTIGDDEIPLIGLGWRHKATVTDTFYSSAFSSVSRATFWDQYTARRSDRLPDHDVCQIMAKHGNLDALKWACRQKRSLLQLPRFPWRGSTTTANAARGGHLMVLKWAHDNGYPWNHRIMEIAAMGGHLAVLKFARKKGYPWNIYICACAAEGGHLHVLQWARRNGCPWDSWTCSCAAMNGHLHVLKWALHNDCPWDSDIWFSAIRGGHQETVDWLQENGYMV